MCYCLQTKNVVQWSLVQDLNTVVPLFNGCVLIGSPLRCEVIDGSTNKTTATARGEGLSSVILGTTAYFEVNPHSTEPTTIDVMITGTYRRIKQQI